MTETTCSQHKSQLMIFQSERGWIHNETKSFARRNWTVNNEKRNGEGWQERDRKEERGDRWRAAIKTRSAILIYLTSPPFLPRKNPKSNQSPFFQFHSTTTHSDFRFSPQWNLHRL